MENLILEVEKHAIALLSTDLPYYYTYHNLGHTLRVVKSIRELIEGEKITHGDSENLIIAGWFHDVGYTVDHNNHEEHSKVLAKDFLSNFEINTIKIENILSLITATKIGHEPQNLAERIICDADFSHLKSKKYMDIVSLLRNEWEFLYNKNLSEIEWINEHVLFLTKTHRFYTNYALQNWQPGKDKNIAGLLKTLENQKLKIERSVEKKQEFDLKKNKIYSPERGIETMFRVTFKNHITLSNIADTKANILLSVNAIIVSLVLSNLIPKLDNSSNHYLIYPTIIFVLFTVSSMILSVLASRPNVTSGKFTKEDIQNKNVNLLFFGNFHKMSLVDFESALDVLMKDRDYLYSSMKKDLYFLGLVLDRKYKLIRITYNVFIIGIVLSVIAFTIAFPYSGVK